MSKVVKKGSKKQLTKPAAEAPEEVKKTKNTAAKADKAAATSPNTKKRSRQQLTTQSNLEDSTEKPKAKKPKLQESPVANKPAPKATKPSPKGNKKGKQAAPVVAEPVNDEESSSEMSLDDEGAVPIETSANDANVDEFADQEMEIVLDQKAKDAIDQKIAALPKTTTVDSNKGTIYIGHIPFGFFEKPMKKFFTQFGTVTRLRLSRSKKTGKSKGYGWVEFENPGVAKIVAGAMHNYLMFGRKLVVEFIEPEKLHDSVWKGANRTFRKSKARDNHIASFNAHKSAEELKESLGHLVKKEDTKRKKLAELGVEYDFPGYKAVQDGKEAPKVPKTPSPAKDTKKASPAKTATPASEKTKTAPAAKPKVVKKKK